MSTLFVQRKLRTSQMLHLHPFADWRALGLLLPLLSLNCETQLWEAEQGKPEGEEFQQIPIEVALRATLWPQPIAGCDQVPVTASACCPAGMSFVGGSNFGDFLSFGTSTNSLCIYAYGGGDSAVVGTRASYIHGGTGDDSLHGSPQSDVLLGRSGVDGLFGYGGDDHILGGDHGDALYGGGGSDKLVGEAGSDDLNGEDGDDELWPGTGSDTSYGDDGNDTIIISAACELSPGEIIDGGLGTDRLITPISPSLLSTYGVTVTNVENFEFATTDECTASCLQANAFAWMEPPEPEPAAPRDWIAPQRGDIELAAQEQLSTGEVEVIEEDLRVQGTGFDFVWVRRYRSRSQQGAPLGFGWDHSYNVYARPCGDGLAVHNGFGRPLQYKKQADGTYTAPGVFRTGQIVDNALTLTFPDGGKWVFNRFDASQGSGKLERIVDRNGNTLRLEYNAAHQLARVVDTHGRIYTITYDAAGRLTEVVDFDGRKITYAYYGSSDPQGGPGDLANVTLPVITGTSTGNDFPSGRTRRYTYSKGTNDYARDHNMLSVVNASGQVEASFTYASTADPLAVDYDRVITRRHSTRDATFNFSYASVAPCGCDTAVRKVWVNDGEGNVSEQRFDASQRLVTLRQYTGRANRLLPTTDTTNRPTNRLRPSDPSYFETRYEYNVDHMLTREVLPRGNERKWTYLGDTATVARKIAGNLVERKELGGTATVAGKPLSYCTGQARQWAYEYALGRGNEFGRQEFVSQETDPTGVTVTQVFDATGNVTDRFGEDPDEQETWTYNSRGQPTSYTAGKDEFGRRQVNTTEYIAPGFAATAGLEYYPWRTTVDAAGLNLQTTYTPDRRGNVVSKTDPRGAVTTYEMTQADEFVVETGPVIGGVRAKKIFVYDAAGNVVRVKSDNLDENRTLRSSNPAFEETATFDENGRELQEAMEISEGVYSTHAYEYDRNGEVIRVRRPNALSGQAPNDQTTYMLDERGFAWKTIQNDGATWAQTVQVDYDVNGNAILEKKTDGGATRVFRQVTYDCFDREVLSVDGMGNETRTVYDAADRVAETSVYGELSDVSGSAGNRKLARATKTYDSSGRLIEESAERFDPVTGSAIGTLPQREIRTLDGRGRSYLTSVVDTAAIASRWDTAGRLERVIQGAHDVAFGRDGADNIVVTTEQLQRANGSWRMLTSTAVFNLDNEQTQESDRIGSVRDYAFDALGYQAQSWDALHAAGQKGNSHQVLFDGLGNERSITNALRSNGRGNGTFLSNLSLDFTWQDDGKPLTLRDPNGNTTTQSYDSAGLPRVLTETGASAATHQFDSDEKLREVSVADGTRRVLAYDASDRLIGETLTPGLLSLGWPLALSFGYDGLGNQTLANSDGQIVRRSFDSLSLLRSEQSAGGTVSYERDTSGRLSKITYPTGTVLDYLRDNEGRLTTIRQGSQTLASYTYEGPNRVATCSVPAIGITTLMNYDGEGNLTGIQQQSGFAIVNGLAYTRDEEGQRLSETNSVTGGSVVATYDSLGRMNKATRASFVRANATSDYTFDSASNWTSKTGGRCAGSLTVDATKNRYSQLPCESLTYDAAGRLRTTTARNSEGRTRTLSYDARGRLARITWSNAGGEAFETQHDYDAYDRRVLTKVKRVTDQTVVIQERYVYDAWNLLEKQNLLDTNDKVRYIYGPYDQLVAHVETKIGRTVYYFTNDVGSTVMAIAKGADGSQKHERIEYEDYGYPYFIQDDGSVTRNSALGVTHLFQGLLWDEATGLYDARTRFLDPVHGRFVMLDTVGIWTDSVVRGNGYVFAGSQPYTSGDPDGMATIKWTSKSKHLSDVSKDDVVARIEEAQALAVPVKNSGRWMNRPKRHSKKRSRYYQTQAFKDYFGSMQDWWQFRNVVRRTIKFERYLRKGFIRLKYMASSGDMCGKKNKVAWTTHGSTKIRLCTTFVDGSNTERFLNSVVYHEVSHMRGHTDDYTGSLSPSAARGLAKRHPRVAKRSASNWQFLADDNKCRGKKGGDRCD